MHICLLGSCCTRAGSRRWRTLTKPLSRNCRHSCQAEGRLRCHWRSIGIRVRLRIRIRYFDDSKGMIRGRGKVRGGGRGRNYGQG